MRFFYKSCLSTVCMIHAGAFLSYCNINNKHNKHNKVNNYNNNHNNHPHHTHNPNDDALMIYCLIVLFCCVLYVIIKQLDCNTVY